MQSGEVPKNDLLLFIKVIRNKSALVRILELGHA